MKINVYMEKYGIEWAYISVFHGIYKKLVENNPDVIFNTIDSGLMRKRGYSNGCKYGPHFMIIENDETKKYIVISYWDKIKNLTLESDVTFWDMENCVEIITGAGTHIDDIYYRQLESEFTPFSYVVARSEGEKIIDDLYNLKKNKSFPDNLSFRGYIYGFRDFLNKISGFNIISTRPHGLTTQQYLTELNNEHLNFSINGAGETCHRDIEILGLGNTLFRTKFGVKFHNELIPNYHYISVDWDDVSQNQDLHSYWTEISDRILSRFEEVKGDHDYIKYVGENGRKWYKENGTILANVNIGYNLINLKKIY